MKLWKNSSKMEKFLPNFRAMGKFNLDKKGLKKY